MQQARESNRRLRIATLALLGAALCGCKPADRTTADTPPRPHIFLITIESLRSDHIGCYGYQRPTTPNLDALAAQATRYDNAYAVTSWTLTSHATIFTGLYPRVHRVTRPKSKLPAAYTTLAEHCFDAGYHTAAAVSGPYLRRKHGLQQGFARYDDSPITPPKASASKDITNARMEAALDAIISAQRQPDQPLFCFAYFWDPHSCYIPPSPYDTMFVPDDAEPIDPFKIQFSPVFKLDRYITRAQLKYMVAQYDGEIRCTDEALGRVLRKIKDAGLWDNALIIVTSDHGEEFYDHGHNTHKITLYDESIHVPLVIKYPNQTQASRDARAVNLIDLFPTILEVAGIDTPTVCTGHSLLAEPEPARPTFYELTTIWSFSRKSNGESWQESKQWTAILQPPHKLIHVESKLDRTEKLPPDRWELYDLSQDPAEKQPLTTGYEELTGELQGEIDRWADAMDLLARQFAKGEEARLSPEEEARLRALGYLP